MSRTDPLDWGRLAAIWRQQEPPATVHTRIARKVRIETRRMRLVMATEATVLLGLGAFTVWALRGPTPAIEGALLAAIWLLALATQAFAIWNRRGNWEPATHETGSFIELSERRATAKIRAARAVRVLAFVQAVIVVAFVSARDGFRTDVPGSGLRLAAAAAAATAMVIGYVVWSIRYERRARREQAELASARSLLRP